MAPTNTSSKVAQYTPGPWEYHEHAPYSVWKGDTQIAACRVTDERGNPVGYLERDNRTTAANARLIAAAPELLQALRELVDATGRIDDDYYETIYDAERNAQMLLTRIDGND